MAVAVEELAAVAAEESMAEVAVVLAMEESVAAVAVTIAGGCDCCLL